MTSSTYSTYRAAVHQRAARKDTSYPQRSGSLKQQGHRSTLSHTERKKKRKNTTQHLAGGLAVLTLILLVVFSFLLWEIGTSSAEMVNTGEPAPEYIFKDGDGSPVDLQGLTAEWAERTGTEKRYDLTDAERWEVASVVTAEAGGEPFAGKVAVAQCILQTCEDEGLRPPEALVEFVYSPHRPEPTQEALEAVQAVFDFGDVATTEPIKYFYAPALVVSDWHETQNYVMTINGHKFFSEKEAE